MTKTTITVGFADMTNYVKLVNKAGDETALQILQQVLQDVGDIIIRHGGTIHKYIGDDVMFLFDKPKPAIEAAKQIAQYKKPVGDLILQYRVAIATGEVYKIKLGHKSNLTDDVMGDTVNRAAVLLKEASQNESRMAFCNATWKVIQGLYKNKP